MSSLAPNALDGIAHIILSARVAFGAEMLLASQAVRDRVALSRA